MDLIFKVNNAASFVASDRSDKSIPLRTTCGYELEFYVNNGDTAYINGEKYPIRKGLVTFSKPGIPRVTIGNFSCMYIHFLCLDKNFEKEYLENLPASVMPADPLKFEELMSSAIRILNGDQKCTELRLESIILEAVAEYTESVYRSSRISGRFQRYIPLVNQTIDYMKNHYLEEITSDMLAEQVHLSTNFFQTVFREITGIPPAKYLRNMRLRSACQMLVNTDFALSEIAELSGFKSGSYMSYVIKQELDTTPSEYRKNNRIML